MNSPIITRRAALWGGMGLAAAMALRPDLVWAEGSVLKVRATDDIQVLDPLAMIGGAEIDIQYACLASLAVYTPGNPPGWHPSAFVDHVEQTDDLHISFALKPGIKWSGDNGELSAEDVKYSFERFRDPKNDSPWKDKWAALKEVQVTGPYSGVIVLKEPFPPLWLTTLCDGTGSIVCKKAVEAAGGKFTTELPAFSGPYQLKAWIQKQRAELVLNPQWKGPKPVFPEIHILFIQDPKTAELAYEAGDLDVTDISLSSLANYKAHLPAQTKLYEAPGLSWTWMGMNTEHPKLKDIRVRRAIQNAVDVDAIIDAAYGGVSTARARGIVPRGQIGYRTQTAFEKPNLDAARKLLKEAGVTALDLEIKVMNQAVNITSATIIQANLAEIGINLTVTQLDSGPFWNLGVESAGNDWKESQLWISRFQDTPDPSQNTQWFVSRQVGIWNWERWKNPAFDALNQQAYLERDPEKRAQMYVKLQDMMEQTGAYVWIAFEPVEVVYRDWLDPKILPPEHLYFADFRKA